MPEALATKRVPCTGYLPTFLQVPASEVQVALQTVDLPDLSDKNLPSTKLHSTAPPIRSLYSQDPADHDSRRCNMRHFACGIGRSCTTRALPHVSSVPTMTQLVTRSRSVPFAGHLLHRRAETRRCYAGCACQPVNRRKIAYVALGSNLGDRVAEIEKACKLMDSRGIHVKRTSSLWETEPMYVKDQDRFLNGACEVRFLGGSSLLRCPLN